MYKSVMEYDILFQVQFLFCKIKGLDVWCPNQLTTYYLLHVS